jgi:hypothetical protein
MANSLRDYIELMSSCEFMSFVEYSWFVSGTPLFNFFSTSVDFHENYYLTLGAL